MEDVEKIFPLLWLLSDNLKIEGNVVKFTGSVADVQEFKDLLTKLDPTFSRGTE